MTAAGAWEHFEHGADIGIRGVGPTREAAFVQAAVALTAVVADPSAVRPAEQVVLQCNAPDESLLLVDWLNAIVYEMATTRRLFGRFEVVIRQVPAGLHLAGTAHGEPVDVTRHHPAVEVKGATHTELRVGPLDAGGWIAQCVVDV